MQACVAVCCEFTMQHAQRHKVRRAVTCVTTLGSGPFPRWSRTVEEATSSAHRGLVYEVRSPARSSRTAARAPPRNPPARHRTPGRLAGRMTLAPNQPPSSSLTGATGSAGGGLAGGVEPPV